MKLKKLFLALMLMLVGAFTATAALITTTGTKPAVGNGNKGKPYEIWTAEELRWFVHYENTRHWYPNDYAKLMCDIDLSSICGPDKGSWIPLGASEENGAEGYYYGDFDGNGHTISGIYIDGEATKECGTGPAFFGRVGGAHIYDLTVEGNVVQVYDSSSFGGLVLEVANLSSKYTKIVNCESRMHFYLYDILPEGAEEPENNSNNVAMGGLVCSWKEYNSNNLENCVFSGAFHFKNTGTGSNIYEGGLVGIMNRGVKFDIVNCSSITGQGLPLIGFMWDASNGYLGTLKNCICDGPIIGLFSKEKQGYFGIVDNFYVGEYMVAQRMRVGYRTVILHLTGENTGNRNIPEEEIANGAATYKMNELMGGKYYTQTIGTDAVPYPNSRHSTVYRVKQYTQCGSEDYVWAYSNTDEDDTSGRQHTFDEDHAYCTGCGTAVNPDYNASYADGYYLLSDARDVKWFWNLVNVTGAKEAKMKLTADIDMAGEPMEPLKKFYGTIDGQGHTLANINIKSSDASCVGLVGNLYPKACIRNLALTGSVESTTPGFVGAFAGKVWYDATISNVRNDCTVKTTGTHYAYQSIYMGGIAGLVDGNTSKVTDCINNGPVVDATTCPNGVSLCIAGGVGLVNNSATVNNLVNNGVVGSYNNTGDIYSQCAPVANFSNAPGNSPALYYVSGITNPGMKTFCSGTPAISMAVSPVDLGSGRLAWMLSGKDYSADDVDTKYWGQSIGTDLAPYPYVTEAHKGIYNKHQYYTCADYIEYTNLAEGTEPSAHTWTGAHYCSQCFAIDETYVPKDADTKVYKISTPEQYNIYAGAVNAASKVDRPTKYASASIMQDIDFATAGHVRLDCLYGHLHGNGHRITVGERSGNCEIADLVDKDGVIEYLDVDYGPSADITRQLCATNRGQIIGCNVVGGVPAKLSEGIVQHCTGQISNDYAMSGRFTHCLIKKYNNGEAECYRLYNTASNQLGYEEYGLEKSETGELAYMLSHGSGNCEWGQQLGKDADPRICYGQTPTSDTYVTRLTTYAAEHPDGIVEYMNAGRILEPAPGYFKVSDDKESWATHPAYNFIVDNGDGTYSAEHINLDPTVQHYLPIAVKADRLTFKETNDEGGLESRSYGFGEIVSLVFPTEMPVSNVNGHVYVFDGYDALNNTLVFTSSLDESDCDIPANTPVLVRTYGGAILNADVTNADVMPITDAGYGELEKVRHLAGYQQTVLPSGKALEDGEYVLYYLLGGDNDDLKATLANTDANTAGQLASYFRLPYVSGSSTQDEISVALVEDRELKTSRIIERDIFSIPYGILDENAEWAQVLHLNDTDHPNIFYGNDVSKDIYANISAYDFMYIHGAPDQKYQFYFNGSEATDVVIDSDGDAFIDLDEHRVGIGDVYLRGIRLAEGETVPADAFAKLYKYLEEGLVLYGYGDFSDELKGYPFYDATGVKCGITLNLDNPNAIVVGGPNVSGVYNRIEKSDDVMQGFTAEHLRLTDGGDFCYDYSVKCPDVAFTRYDVPEGMRYVTFVLPFAANAVKGMHEYIDCDGKSVYFNTSDDGVIDAYLPIVIDMEEYEGNTITITGADFLALSPNGVFNVAPIPASQNGLMYGFVTRRQEEVTLDNAEIAGYNVYGYSTKSYKFVRAVDTFSISPFRAFFMLPKSSAARTMGYAVPEIEVEAMDIVLDGQVIDTGITGIENVTLDTDPSAGAAYNILGMPVGSDYRGIVIRNGRKIYIK